MPSSGSNRSETSVNRRRLLQAIGVASAAGLAGCGSGGGGGDSDGGGGGGGGGDSGGGDSGGGGGGDSGGGGGSSGDLGERVPTLTFQYWSDQGPPTVLFEETISQIQANIGEIGVGIETMAMTTGQGIDEVANDTRQFHFAVNSHGPDPARLDPNDLLTNYSAYGAGSNGRYNPANYANCEFTGFADQQRNIGDREERQGVVDDAMSVYSEDIAFITTIERPTIAAANTDQITEIEAGAAGLTDIQWAAFLESGVQTKSGTDAVVASLPSELLTSSFYPTVADSDALVLYTNMTTSPLVMYDSNYELQPNLAESWETNAEGTRTEFVLADATFHNGDPVTPEDVKWTYEFLRDRFHDGTYAWTDLPEDLTVEVVDDSTVAFVTESSAPTLVTSSLAVFGVLPQEPYVNAGIEDNPTDFDDPMIGAGPYQITAYNNQQNIALEPHDGHPLYSPTADVFAQIYESVDSVVRAMESGELNLAVALHPEASQQLRDSMGDSVQIINGKAHLPFGVMPQMSFAPAMFREFRLALSNLIDRRNLNETYAFGESDIVLHSTFNSNDHPWHNADVLTQIADETANPERARQVLEDAGWGWDSDGNLHYPPDAELEAWPQGETPSTDDFSCLS